MKKISLFLLSFLLLNCSTEKQEQFALYDAITYPGKPDLTSHGLLPVYLMYEAVLTKKGVDGENRVVLDLDKLHKQAEMAAIFPDVMVSTDIEDWFWDKNVDIDDMHIMFSTMFDIFREKNKDVVIGNYGIAPSSLAVHRFYHKEKEDSVILESWRKSNLKRWESIKAVDVIMPVVYIGEPDIDSWIRDLDITISEIKKYDSKKKIIVYIWPQYYNKPDSPYNSEVLSPEVWRQMLEAVYEKCDGAIIWSARKDNEGNTLYWNDDRIQSIWKETLLFMEAHKGNMQKPLPEKELIMQEVKNKSFKIFASLSYPGTPDITAEGIHKIKLVNEKSLSSGIDSNKIYVPDMAKIEELAENAMSDSDIPVCITGGTWIIDRKDNPDMMIQRYASVNAAFKNKNSDTKLGFVFVGPASLSGLRVSIGNFFVNTGGWMHSSVKPTRPLREYADYMLPASYIVDDDMELWRKEFYLTIQEAKLNNPGKPIYAYLYTDYFNKEINFPEAYKPIRESTWKIVLETAFNLCDGVVMSNIGSSKWDDDFGFWKATKEFIEEYKDDIDFPSYNNN